MIYEIMTLRKINLSAKENLFMGSKTPSRIYKEEIFLENLMTVYVQTAGLKA